MPATETTTTKKKRTTRRKTAKKTKSYSADEVAEMLEEAKATAQAEAEQEFEQRRLESEFADDGMGEDTGTSWQFGGENNIGFDEGGDSEEAVNAFDLFEYIQSKFASHGTLVLYQVKKDGHFMGEHHHPITWAQLQKKYGGGHYTVLAKRAADKTYLKQQTQLLADLPTNTIEEKPETPTIQIPQAPREDSAALVKTVMETFTRLNELKSDEKARIDRDERKADTAFNNTFLTLLTQQQQNSQQMFMEMQKNTQEMMKTISENFSRSQEKAEDKFQRMIEKIADQGNKKENFGTMELIAMMKDAEDRGWSKMETLLALADAKAEEKADNDSSDTGMVGKLIGGILPMLTTANQAQQAQLQQQLQQQRGGVPPQQQERNLLPPQKGELKRPPHNQGRVNRPAPDMRPKSNVGLPTFDTSHMTVKPPVDKNVAHNATEVIETGDDWGDGAEIVTEPPKVVHHSPNERVQETAQVNESIDDILKVATPEQQAIAQIAVPRIAQNIFNDTRPAALSAQDVLHDVIKVGGTKEVLLAQFPFDFMLRIARAFGIGPEKDQWFEEFYAYFENPTGMDSQGVGEPPASGTDEVATRSAWEPSHN